MLEIIFIKAYIPMIFLLMKPSHYHNIAYLSCIFLIHIKSTDEDISFSSMDINQLLH